MARNFFLAILFSLSGFAAHGQMTAAYTEWVNKANALFAAKKFRPAAEAFGHAFAANGGKGTLDDRYNAACAWALAGNNDSAFFQLDRIATRANFMDYDHLIEDGDLQSLHKDSRWKDLIAQVKQNKEKAEANVDRELKASLDSIYELDQGGRREADEMVHKYGSQSEDVKKLWLRIAHDDSVNLIRVKAIIEKYGYPGPDIASARGSETVFLVIQHADIATQDKYLPLMRQAVKDKKIQPSSLAMLEDRINIRHGQKQQYGSQITVDAIGNFLAPLEDPDHVDERRASVGLGPLADYLRFFNLDWDPAVYKVQLPELEKRQSKIQY